MIDEKCHDFVTDFCHVIRSRSPAEIKFLKRALEINLKEKRPFHYKDFGMTSENFRQMIHRVKGDLELVINTKPKFWKIKGCKLPGDHKKITFRDTGELEPLFQILESLKNQRPMIHDVKIKIHVKLHTALVKGGYTVNKNNHGILVNIPIASSGFTFKTLVYPKIVQLDVGCSLQPLVYDTPSMLDFFEKLKEVSLYLSGLTMQDLPPISEWIITHFHLNRDGSSEYNGKMFHMSISDMIVGFIRFYSKKLPNGKTIPRIEKIELPNIPMDELMIQVANQGEFNG